MKYGICIYFFLLAYICSGQTKDVRYFTDLAIQNSPLLKGYQNQLLQIRLDSFILRSSQKTQVNLISNNLYAPVIGGWGYDEAITNLAQVSGLVQVSRNFLSAGHSATLLRSLALQGAAFRDTIQLTIRDLVRTITDQYITAYADQLTRDYNHQLFELLKAEEETLKKLAQASVIKQTEFLAFTITLQQQELTYQQADIQFMTDYLTLNYLAGSTDTALHRLTEPVFAEEVAPDFLHSVFYTRYITDSLRIVNEKQLLAYSYRPSINAFTDAGLNSTLQQTPYKNIGFSAGLNIRVPIYDAHQRRFRLQKLDIEERTRAANRDFFLQQYRQQTALLRLQLQQLNGLRDKIDRQVQYTHTLIESYARLLQTSDVKVTDFVTAVTSYLNVQNVLRQTIITRLRIQNQLHYFNQ